MFLYVQNRYNPRPSTVLLPPDEQGVGAERCAWVRGHDAPLMIVPRDPAALRARRRAKFWADVRRRERRFEERFGALGFERVADPRALEEWLPKVHALFLARWRHTHTGSAWATERGFEPYADAMRELAAEGVASLHVLYRTSDRGLLAYSYDLEQDRTLYLYQHSAAQDPELRGLSPGVLFMTKLVTEIVERGQVDALDFMIGIFDYKLDWARCVQRTYRLVRRGDYASDFAWRLGIAHEAARFAAANDPRVRRWVKPMLRPRRR